MGLKTFWNKLKYWQRGAIIGFVLSLVFVFLFSLYIDSTKFKSPEPVSFGQAFIIMFVVYIIPATIAGSIIGFIISRFVKKYKNE